MLKDYKSRKQGETWSASDKVANQLLAGGFAAEVEEDEDPNEDEPQSAAEEEEDSETEQEDEPAPSSETDEDEEKEDPDPHAESTDEDEEEEPKEEEQALASNSNLDHVPAGELANLSHPSVAPSVTPNGMTQVTQAASPQLPVAPPLPARYAAHRSHIRPR